MQHTAWTARDGAPQAIVGLTKAVDGTMWIASESGLFNFDGHSFRQFKGDASSPNALDVPIESLLAAKDGSVWVGLLHGGIAHIVSDRVTFFHQADDSPIHMIEQLSQAPDGSIWGSADGRKLIRYGQDGRWHKEPTPPPVSPAQLQFFIDSTNTLWVGYGLLYRRALPQLTYTKTDNPVGLVQSYSEVGSGNFWLSDVDPEVDRGRTRLFDHLGHLISELSDPVESNALLVEPNGHLLLATQNGGGLRRYVEQDLHAAGASKAKPNFESYREVDGLSSNSQVALLLDDEKNVWVAGARGLDRFRRARLVPFLPRDPAGTWSVCSGKTGTLWISSTVNQLYELTNGAAREIPNIGDPFLLACGKREDAWMADHSGILHIESGTVKPIPPPPHHVPFSIVQIAAASDNSLYMVRVGRDDELGGLWQFKNGAWTKLLSLKALGSVMVGYVDPSDRLWVGLRDGSVRIPLENRKFTAGPDDLEVVRVLLQTSHGMVAGGDKGFAVLRHDLVEKLLFENEDAGRGVVGIVESNNGDLWLNAMHGIVHLKSSEVESALAQPHHKMKSEILTEGEFVGTRLRFMQTSTTGRDDHGGLWFATLNSVVRIDPDETEPDRQLPKLSIKSVLADNLPLDASSSFPANPQSVLIRYLGAYLTAPERVTYRYRLLGFDDAWQDAGKRTEAIYTHLPPGTFTFQVMASSGADAWTAPLSAETFTVLPAVYQTLWFKWLCIVAGVLMVLLIFVFRLRVLAQAIRKRYEERADERVRIARELHDTLLQGIQGLLLTLHVAAQRLSADNELRGMIENALSTADRLAVEGRNRVNSLRLEQLTDGELLETLEAIGKELNAGGNLEFSACRQGLNVKLQPHVAEEMLLVAREALTNSFRHAHATKVSVELCYGNRFFRMHCHDDGDGFSPDRHLSSGHWGLKGMAERVESLGGQLHVESARGKGTTIQVVIPSFRAYVNHTRIRFYVEAFNPFAVKALDT